MIRLYDIVAALSKEENRNVTLFLNRTNAHDQRKDTALFDYIRKNKGAVIEEEILLKLYGNAGEKNAFYRLKNRLAHEVNKSLLQLHADKNPYNEVVNLFLLSRIFASKEAFDISYQYLKNAEKKAVSGEFYDLLDLIYSDLIKLSQESLDYNPIRYIEQRKANHKVLHALQEIDDMLAALMYRIKISQNYSKANFQFTELFQKTIDEFVNDKEIRKSTRLQLKIYHSISRILLQQRDYTSLEDYLKLTYNDFINRKLFTKDNHDSKLQMLTYLVNALFKNNRIHESLQVTEELYAAMHEYEGMLYNKYLFYYYNSQVINYQVTDKPKAIEVLLEAKTKPEIQNLSFYTVFVYLNLAVLYFDTGHYRNARTNLAKLKMSDTFPKMDEVFRLKVTIFELLTFYEIGDIDLFDYQLQSLRKEFKTSLADPLYEREVKFISIVAGMDQFTREELKREALEFQVLSDSSTRQKNDNDIIDYNEWLVKKTKQKRP
ncbi:MAG: hypothetical protein KDD41_10525 [Flavobacteriales bacterium]|nr:hypothetical protein [Flavobacteriales bacterium]